MGSDATDDVLERYARDDFGCPACGQGVLPGFEGMTVAADFVRSQIGHLCRACGAWYLTAMERAALAIVGSAP